MGYIHSVARHQLIIFPETVEDYITEDNPVRFIPRDTGLSCCRSIPALNSASK